MKLNIFEEGKKVESEKKVYLKLRHGHHNAVVVCVCDEKGNQLLCGNLIAFYPDGTVRRMGGVNVDAGFQLDAGGYIHERMSL